MLYTHIQFLLHFSYLYPSSYIMSVTFVLIGIMQVEQNVFKCFCSINKCTIKSSVWLKGVESIVGKRWQYSKGSRRNSDILTLNSSWGRCAAVAAMPLFKGVQHMTFWSHQLYRLCIDGSIPDSHMARLGLQRYWCGEVALLPSHILAGSWTK